MDNTYKAITCHVEREKFVRPTAVEARQLPVKEDQSRAVALTTSDHLWQATRPGLG